MDLHSLNMSFLSHKLSGFLWQTSQVNSITRGDKESGSVPKIWSQLASFCWANYRSKSCVPTANSQNNRLVAGALCFLMVAQIGRFSSPTYRLHVLLLWADPRCKRVHTKWSPRLSAFKITLQRVQTRQTTCCLYYLIRREDDDIFC